MKAINTLLSIIMGPVIVLPSLAQVSGWKVEQVSYTITKKNTRQDEQKKVMYITDKAVRIEENNGTSITLLTLEADSPIIYVIKPQQKQYFVMSAGWLYFGLFASYITCSENTNNEHTTNCWIDTTTFQPTSEYATINGYRARKVLTRNKLLDALSNKPAIQWVTKEWSDLNEAMSDYNKFLKKMFLQKGPENQLITKLFDYIEDIGQKYGQTIKTEATLFGSTAVTETISVERSTFSSQLFTLPEGYTRIESPFMQTR